MIRLLAVAVLALSLAACGGEDPKPEPVPGPVPAPAPEPATPEAPAPDDPTPAAPTTDAPAAEPPAGPEERFATREEAFAFVRGQVDRWLHGEGDMGLLEEALEVQPDDGPASMILSDIRWGEGETEAAMALLERAAPKTKEMSACGADVLFRLAVRRLQSGDAKGWAEAVARIPADFSIRHLADSLGQAKEAGAVVVPGRPASRPGATEATAEGLVFTADELDPEAVIRSGHVVVLDRVVAGGLVPEVGTIVLWGYLPGLDAFLTDDPSPAVFPVMPASEVRTGLIRVRDAAAAKGATGKVRGTEIDQALDDLAAGRLKEAWDGLDGHMDHPLARFVRARIALTKGLATEAVLLITGEAKKPLPGAGWALLYGEALLAKGEVGRALQVLKRSEREDCLRPGHPLTRRIGALTLMKADDDSATIAALGKLVGDHPRYAGAWEDLAGLHLAAGRYAEGRDALIRLAGEVPEIAKLPRYLLARRRAAAGLIDGARTAETLMMIDDTEEAGIRRLAVLAAQRLPVAEMRKVHHHFLADPDTPTRILALRRIAQDGWEGSRDAVRPCLEDPDPKVRGAAVRTWRLISDRKASVRLADFLTDGEQYVREVAIHELRELSGKRFGYEADAPEDERKAAADRWQEWAKSLE